MRWDPLAAVLAFLLPATAAACSCASLPMVLHSNLASDRAIIFVGTVEAEVAGGTKGNFFTQVRLLRIRPHFFLRGSWPSRPAEIWGGSIEGSGDCGAPFVEGTTYFVVAERFDDGALTASRCSLTGPLWGYSLSFGILAALLLLAGVTVRGAWRLLRRLLRGGSRGTSSRLGPMLSPRAWLAVSAVLVALVVLLWNLPTRLSSPVGVAVCNETAVESLERVEARWISGQQSSVPVPLGDVPRGQCRTVLLPFERGASLRLAYEHQGVEFTVQDAVLSSAVSGDRTYTKVLGPGRTESGMEFPEPDPRLLVVYFALLASVSGVLATLLCATWSAFRARVSARSAQRGG